MAKPIGITLGIVGSKAPLPPEAVLEHAKPLQVEITELPSEPVKPKRGKKVQVPQPTEAVEPTSAPVIELTLPPEEES
jgi:hypothetical protein